MHFNNHSDLIGQHAFLGASKYHWLNYTDDKLDEVYRHTLAVKRGTELHEFAAQAIRLGVKLPQNSDTLNQYVNDAIDFHMRPEQVLFYSRNCFGTADAISFRDDLLRIHDLKTGKIKASMFQLEIYAAIFCLEYCIDPTLIQNELRIYQNSDIQIYHSTPDEILAIMDKICRFDQRIEQMRGDGLG